MHSEPEIIAAHVPETAGLPRALRAEDLTPTGVLADGKSQAARQWTHLTIPLPVVAVTPAGRGKAATTDLRTPAERHRVMASIEDPTAIGQILGHLASRELPAGSRPPSRGPPQGELELL